MNEVSRQHPAFSFAQPQTFRVEDTGDIGSRAISLADAGGKVMCHSRSLVLSEAPCALHISAHLQRPTCGCSLNMAALSGYPAWPGHMEAPGNAKGCPGLCPVVFWIALRCWPSLCHCSAHR